MQRKFRLDDSTWNAFINKTNSPSETLRELVNNYIEDDFPLNQVIGVEAAAKLWGLSPGYIKNLCAEGKLQCKKIGQTWILNKNQPNPKSSE